MAFATATTDTRKPLSKSQLATLDRIARKGTTPNNPPPSSDYVLVADLPRSCYPSLRPLARAGMLYYDHDHKPSPRVGLTLQGLVLWRLSASGDEGMPPDPPAHDPTHPAERKPIVTPELAARIETDANRLIAAFNRRTKARTPRLAEVPDHATPPPLERFAPGDEARVWERIRWARTFAHTETLQSALGAGEPKALAYRKAGIAAEAAGRAEWDPAWAEFFAARGINSR